MFKKIYLDPENKSFAEVMSNGKSYAVPAFQRDYTWQEEQLDELWRDMQYMQTQKAQHFMGYLVRPVAVQRRPEPRKGPARMPGRTPASPGSRCPTH